MWKIHRVPEGWQSEPRKWAEEGIDERVLWYSMLVYRHV